MHTRRSSIFQASTIILYHTARQGGLLAWAQTLEGSSKTQENYGIAGNCPVHSTTLHTIPRNSIVRLVCIMRFGLVSTQTRTNLTLTPILLAV